MGDLGQWRCYRTILRRFDEGLPTIKVSAQFYNLKTRRHVPEINNELAFPRKRYPTGEYGSLWESAQVKVCPRASKLRFRCLYQDNSYRYAMSTFSIYGPTQMRPKP